MCAARRSSGAAPVARGWFEIDHQCGCAGPSGKPRQPLPDHQRAGAGPGRDLCQGRGRYERAPEANPAIQPLTFVPNPKVKLKVPPRDRSVIRLPSYEQVKADPVLYAHANRVLHLETNPGNARALVQAHGEGVTARDVWINPPPIPLTTAEMDHVFDLPYARSPHPAYADEHGSHDGATKIPPGR
jgi:hypothetical protein